MTFRPVVAAMLIAGLVGACDSPAPEDDGQGAASGGEEAPEARETASATAGDATSDTTGDDALAAIRAAVNDNPLRTPEQMARDKYRHPVETLRFFGIEPGMTVAEALPGWYTEILAHLLREEGRYIGFNLHPDNYADSPRYQEAVAQWRENFTEENAELFAGMEDRADARFVAGGEGTGIAEPGSVDAVIAMRAFHGWVGRDVADAVLADIHSALKPGGTFGVVQHREDESSENTPEDGRGYLKQSFVIETVENAGFELVGTGEINANPKDTKDYEPGVWALPPSLRVDDPELREKHLEIGESDRMTLKFVKR